MGRPVATTTSDRSRFYVDATDLHRRLSAADRVRFCDWLHSFTETRHVWSVELVGEGAVVTEEYVPIPHPSFPNATTLKVEIVGHHKEAVLERHVYHPSQPPPVWPK